MIEDSRLPTRARSRRSFLLAAVGIPAVGATAYAAGRLRGMAPLLRPVAAGTSADRCALCGGRDHTMLQAACPARPDLL